MIRMRALCIAALAAILFSTGIAYAEAYKVQYLLRPGMSVSIGTDVDIIAEVTEAGSAFILRLMMFEPDAEDPLIAKLPFKDRQRHQIVVLHGPDDDVLRTVEALRRGAVLHLTARSGGFETLLAQHDKTDATEERQVTLPVYRTVPLEDIASKDAENAESAQVAMESDDLRGDLVRSYDPAPKRSMLPPPRPREES